MMNFPEWLIVCFIAVSYLLVLVGIELLYRWKRPDTEITRKVAHLTAGLFCVSFSYVFENHWMVLLLVVAFVLLMMGTRKAGILHGIHDINRPSRGAVYFPLAVYLTFVLSSVYEKPHFYVISILVLTISDTLAALIGAAYGYKIFRVEARERKSFEGSVVFFMTTFIIVHLGLLLLSDIGRLESVLCGLLVALLVSGFESISLGGSDNFFIPLGTWFVLMKCTTQPAAAILWDIGLIGVIFLLVYVIIFLPKPKLSTSAFIGITLIGYGAWSLVSYTWFVPILLSLVLFCHSRFFFEKTHVTKDIFRIRPVFYMGVLPFFWIMIANLQAEWEALFILPYVVSIASQFSLSWLRKIRFPQDNPDEIFPAMFLKASTWVRAFIIMLLFLPLQMAFERNLPVVYTLVAGFLGILLVDWLYARITDRYRKVWTNETDRVKYLRLGLVVRSVVSVLILGGNVAWYYEWI